jgi:hypothetical protein
VWCVCIDNVSTRCILELQPTKGLKMTTTLKTFDHALLGDLDDMIQRLSNAGFPQAVEAVHNIYLQIEMTHRTNQAKSKGL